MIKRPKIYVASSWRNKRYPGVVAQLKGIGDVYDFRNDGNAFDWGDIDPDWPETQEVALTKFIALLDDPLAVSAHWADTGALYTSDVCVLCTPCGSSAHFEAGIAIGLKIPLIIYAEQKLRPELTYSDAEYITDDFMDLFKYLQKNYYEVI